MDAINKVQAGCEAYGGTGGSGSSNDGSSSSGGSSTRATSSTAQSGSSPSTTFPTPTSQLPPSTSSSNITPAPTTTTGTPSSATLSRSSSSPTSSSSLPTDMPLALLPTSDQLSAGAKAGISVSVAIFALSVFCALGWYIRRLKRELKAAQRAAAGIPDDVWRSSIATAAAPGGSLDRQSSFGRGRRMSRYGRESPVSPLSPRDMAEIMTVTDNGYGVLKKKRGHVLSVVVEREEEDGSSMIERILVREPVPGQREGLSGPLELDGEGTGIVELPIAITPRERSMERERGGYT
ncbi:hypothetical protein N0V83_005255 [Neocucurbitaria cava]|uniref:Uncharacterized protein n=1 Tax=Neocucurbitaria cava TaxID=798079 RepID=A0A9W8Y9B6_9PLEO|nr:hypothetical protein N0V83_005255 [Neocucurbitaria cava]